MALVARGRKLIADFLLKKNSQLSEPACSVTLYQADIKWQQGNEGHEEAEVPRVQIGPPPAVFISGHTATGGTGLRMKTSTIITQSLVSFMIATD